MIGDRLYTDIAAGRNSGVTSLLVLTGETDASMLGIRPRRADSRYRTARPLRGFGDNVRLMPLSLKLTFRSR